MVSQLLNFFSLATREDLAMSIPLDPVVPIVTHGYKPQLGAIGWPVKHGTLW